ncbi:MAG: ATP--guanido phosphotransferase [Defluviitaleaceae bacterium]|nr:ATP--guanido phosphotransferase [Defluviitaleaceae bacterium]
MKWFEQAEVDKNIVISSRVRLARNLDKFAFPYRLNPAMAKEVLQEVCEAVSGLENRLDFMELTSTPPWESNVLYERHLISRHMAEKTLPCGIAYGEGENLSIMINEEDHIRIQAVFEGNNLEAAYKKAMEADNALGQDLDYAFDGDFGFLTSCPTNTGTGLRASYMLHIPFLESTGMLKAQAEMLTKTGFAIRGAHGEGSSPRGGIYQISNQITLGKSEDEIITAIQRLVEQIADKEAHLRTQLTKDLNAEVMDAIWRAHGILANCRKIALDEAMKLLSDIRLGIMMGILPPPMGGHTIYSIMTNIQDATLQAITMPADDARHLEILRADYLRQCFNRPL